MNFLLAVYLNSYFNDDLMSIKWVEESNKIKYIVAAPEFYLYSYWELKRLKLFHSFIVFIFLLFDSHESNCF